MLKIDDIGNSLGINRWKYFFDIILANPDYYVDLGIIPHYYDRIITESEINYLKQLLNTNRVSLFNHGWDHVAPEFDDSKSFEYIDEHLKKWDKFMATNFQNGYSNIKALGAPGNTFGQLPNSPIYQALEINNYSVLYFSQESGNNDDGKAGLDLEYVKAEYIINGKLTLRDVDEIIDAINLSDAKAILLQLHPSHRAWDSNLIKNFFDRIYTETDREGINIDNYILDHFFPDHPNYFLYSQPMKTRVPYHVTSKFPSPHVLSSTENSSKNQDSGKSNIRSFISSIHSFLNHNKYTFYLYYRLGNKFRWVLSFAILIFLFILYAVYLTFNT